MQNEIAFTGNTSIFSTRLRELMNENKTTQQELANFVGTTRQAISQYMDGSVQPNIEKLYKISNFFKISSDYFIGKTDIRTPDVNTQEICKNTGLSEHAVEILKYYHNYEAYMKTVSFILEQEVPFDEDFRFKHESNEKKEYRDLIPIIGLIIEYFGVCNSPNETIKVNYKGISKSEERRKGLRPDSTILEISENTVIDYIFSMELYAVIKKAKQKFNNKEMI